VATTGLWIAAALVLSVALALYHSPLEPLPGVLVLLLVPGAVVLSLLGTRPSNSAGRLVLAVCLSMTVIMVVGVVVSLLGPHLGLAHPLSPLPESMIWVILTAAALWRCEVKRCDPLTWIFDGVGTAQLYGVLASGLLVVLSILGAAQLNRNGDNHLAIFATTLDVVVLLAGIVGGWSKTSRWPLNTLLYSASLALLVSTSLRGGHLYGWDIQQEFGVASRTLRNGVWVVPANHDPYASMLSLTVLPTILHSLTRLRLVAFFELVVPAILALLPLAVFSTVRSVPRWITSGRTAPRAGLAFAVVVGLIVSSEAYSSQLVTITRQAMALTMVAAIVMVLFDRTVLKRPAQITIGLLIVAVSFTHYTTSYLLSAILLCAWLVGLLWSKGLLGTTKANVEKHRRDMRSRNIINGALVAVALVAAFGWNLAITRNNALANPIAAVSARGVGLTSSTLTQSISSREFEHLLAHELGKTDGWIVPVPGSSSVHLAAATFPSSPGVAASLEGLWNKLVLLATEAPWILLGLALLYGLFRLGRRRSYEYSADLVGIGVAGLVIGGILRFSGTLASYYDPERAAIFTAILLAAPVTVFLDDVLSPHLGVGILSTARVRRVLLVAGSLGIALLVVDATGLGALLFGGQAPGSLSARDLQAEEFTVSTPELATAEWIHAHVHAPGVVQTDYLGQVVLLSQPGSYGLLPEIVPRDVDEGAYIYLSTLNLAHKISQASTTTGTYQIAYQTTIGFFNRHFYVVYSTGATRVYH